MDLITKIPEMLQKIWRRFLVFFSMKKEADVNKQRYKFLYSDLDALTDLIIANGANIYAVDKYSKTALHFAAAAGNLRKYRLFLIWN